MSAPLYLGTSDFAATVLRGICERGVRPSLVITPPDRRQGRGRKSGEAPVAVAAAELELPVHKTADLNSEASAGVITATGADTAMVCAFGQIVREPLLSEILMLNVHPSLLPRWRGAAPIERAIMAGDAETGVCVMRLEAGLDSGPVALSEKVAIETDEDFGSLSGRLAVLGGEMAAEALVLAQRGELKLREQPEVGVTYAEKIEKSERRLDPARPALELNRVVRALTPHVGAYLQFEDGERLAVIETEVLDADLAISNPRSPGDLIVEEGQLRLACGEGDLLLKSIQPPGKRPMAAADYLRGYTPPASAPTFGAA